MNAQHATRVWLWVVVCVSVSVAVDNGLGLTPQMAWSSWNAFNCNINETIIRSIAQAMVKNGLDKSGYAYVNVDDCWAGSRNASGFIEPDPKTFPSGMKALADYIHSLGLKFGVYSDAGYKTCCGRPGSYGYEKQDAEQYAAWGVDYLKYDNCYAPPNVSDATRTQAMRDALNATGRHIFFSLCEGYIGTALFGPSTGNSWRTTIDIGSYFESWVNNIDQNDAVAQFAAPGGWNDPDMLEVGNGQLTPDQNVAHFSLWAVAKAPLILGNDLRSVPSDVLGVITNPEVIAVSQDKLGKQGTRLSYSKATSGTTYGNILYAEACTGSPAQQFVAKGNTIISPLTGMCVGQYAPTWYCDGYSASPGSALYLQECGQLCGGKYQNFTFDTKTSAIQSNFGTLCVEGYATDRNQTDIRLNYCNPSYEQTWTITSNGEIKSQVGDCLTVSRGDEVWGAPMSDGSFAVVLFNRASVSQNVSVEWTYLGYDSAASVRDLWAHKDEGSFSTSYSALVNAQGAVALRITPA